ncbi:putative phage integrase [Thauera chlorobenzoica]|uniref:Putative phage integrase n=2 Tax=Thauera chlorobenzoica TaxID=96773 RepID=A0A1L6FDA7_9RHOO|nr:putative phage integrase [Thauera chlorobenzoica]
MPRLAVRARPSGSRAFVFKGTLHYKDIRVTIGSTDTWTIEAARDEARRYQRWIDEGKDPRDELKAAVDARTAEEASRVAAVEEAAREAEQRSRPAIEAWGHYLEARRAKWSASHLRDHERLAQPGGDPITRGKKTTEDGTTQPGLLRPLLMRPLVEIDAALVQSWLKDQTAKRPTQAALAFRLLRAFLNWAAEDERYQAIASPQAHATKKVREELPKRTAKDDCLQREQLRPWFEKVRAIKNPVIAAYLQGALLTGARREELAALRWEDVDFQWNTLRIRDKVEGERVIPLTPYVAQLLRDLKRRNDTPPAEWRILHGKRIKNDLEGWAPGPWVFASPRAEVGYLQEPRIQHQAACREAGIDGLTIHGLRRSFGSLAEWVEVPTGVVAQIMGHKPSATAEKHYRRRPLDLLRKWHTAIEVWILEEAGIEVGGAVEAPALVAVGVGK